MNVLESFIVLERLLFRNIVYDIVITIFNNEY